MALKPTSGRFYPKQSRSTKVFDPGGSSSGDNKGYMQYNIYDPSVGHATEPTTQLKQMMWQHKLFSPHGDYKMRGYLKKDE